MVVVVVVMMMATVTTTMTMTMIRLDYNSLTAKISCLVTNILKNYFLMRGN